MSIEDVKSALDYNQGLTDEVRDNLFSLCHILHQEYPEFDLTNLVNNLKTLQFKKAKKFISKRVSKYDFSENIVELNVDKMNEDYDFEHIMMSNILHIATNNGKQTGFDDGTFTALNEGYTEIVSNLLIGNESSVAYLDEEKSMADLMLRTLGNDVLEKAYFTNNTELLNKALVEKAVNVIELNNVCNTIFEQEDNELKKSSYHKLDPVGKYIGLVPEEEQKDFRRFVSTISTTITDPELEQYTVLDKNQNLQNAETFLDEAYIPSDIEQIKTR